MERDTGRVIVHEPSKSGDGVLYISNSLMALYVIDGYTRLLFSTCPQNVSKKQYTQTQIQTAHTEMLQFSVSQKQKPKTIYDFHIRGALSYITTCTRIAA